jgi:hypothetical protein
MMNPQRNENRDGVNGSASNTRCTSPRSDAVVNQAAHDGQPTTGRATRRRYTREDNRAIMECYYASLPDTSGYRQRMHRAWIERGHLQINEQRMADQVRNIIKRKWFTDEELDEIKQSALGRVRNNDDQDKQTQQVPTVEVETVPVIQENIQTEIRETFELRRPETDEEQAIVREIEEKRASIVKERPTLKALRNIDRHKIREEVKRLDKVLDCVATNDITEVNDTILACASIVTERLSKNTNKERPTNAEPA